MARIAVLEPNLGFLTGDRTLHRYAEVFMELFSDGVVSYDEAKTYQGDAIVCFNGRPDLDRNHPPKEFKGLKVVHLMDHVFQVERALKNLREHDVHYVLGYNRHDKYDPFFQAHFGEYVEKLIPVPFGFNDLRFRSTNRFSDRINKVVGLGAVNPVSDPLCLTDIELYTTFHKNERWTHRWRKKLSDSIHFLENEMDSYFPQFPETKKFDYDILETYNAYKMFTTCEGIMNYPSVKVFEGMACGSVFIGNDNDCYKAIGLVSGQNCLLHRYEDVEDFKRTVQWAQENPKALEEISLNGQRFVRENFTPFKIASYLNAQLTSLIK
jgi:glycosyltransferase involved in cell wall biosynthesis